MAKASRTGKARADLPRQLWNPLFAAGTPRRLAAGDVLFSSGDRGDGCYRVERGLLKVQMDSPTGERRIVSLVRAGDIVGELSLIDGLPRSATVIALRDSDLRFVSREAFERHVGNSAERIRTLAAVLSVRLRDADATIAASTFLSVRGRVARALLELAEQIGQDDGDGCVVIDVAISQGDLAAMAGAARENVSRVFSDFRKRKLVTAHSRGLRLNDIAALENELKND